MGSSSSKKVSSCESYRPTNITSVKPLKKDVKSGVKGARKRSLADYPSFLKALENDESNCIACYDANGELDYLSDNTCTALGYCPDASLDTLEYAKPPHQGAIYFRKHADGSLLQFHNTLSVKLDTGEMFTIDHPEFNVVKSSSFSLSATLKGDIVTCKLQVTNFVDIKGKNLFCLCPKDHTSLISDALSGACNGKSTFNLFTKICVDMRTYDVVMDFHPCTQGHVGILVSLINDSLKDGDGGVSCMNIEGVNMRSRSHDSDEETVDVDSSSRSGLIKPSKNEAYYLGRRLRELSFEIQYLQDFRDNAILPMYSIVKSGHIVWANDAMITLMGFADTRDEYIGSITFKYHVDQDLVKYMVKTVLGGDPLIDFPCKIVRRDGVILDVTYNSSAKFDSKGGFSHSRCIVQDVTKQNQLLRERDEMERKKLTAEVNEKVAITASKTKSDFLAVMSHEIRTPINGVIGATSLLKTTSLNDEQQSYLNTISDSADILLSLIHNILDISKIEKGKFQLESVPMRLSDLVRKCVNMMENQANDKGLSILATIDDSLDFPDVWHHGDPTRMNQVILNFLSNAVKFTHKGSVECKVRTVVDQSKHCHTSAGAIVIDNSRLKTEHCDTRHTAQDVIRLEIIDTGVGVEDCSKLFLAFVQATPSVYQKYGGTGLGLNIAKNIINLMNGEVGMTSEVGVGTTVWAEFPLKRAPVPRKGPTPVNSSRSNLDLVSSRSITQSVNILIVEDNKVNQKVLKRMLETLGYSNISVAWNGQEAVDAVKGSWEQSFEYPDHHSRFDIVLMDCLMPVMNGWDATIAIRKYEKEALMKAKALSITASPSVILALTANATEEDKKRCSDCFMDGFYTKPLSRDELNSLMLQWVARLCPLN